MVVDELIEILSERAERRSLQDVRLGLGYTAVRLDNGACGLAFTYRDEVATDCSVLGQAGSVAGRPAAEVVHWANALDTVAAAVGVATLNALIEPPACVEQDVLQMLNVGAGDVVGMVGYFGPLIEPLRQVSAALHIFERKPHEEAGVHPDWAAPLLLPECDVVILSSATLINRTLDSLLERASAAREVVLLGPSTPMLAEVFRKRGVTLLSGVRITDPDRLLKVVSEGGGTRRFGGAVQKLTLRLMSPREPGRARHQT